MKQGPLELVIELTLSGGLLVSAVLLIGGLALPSAPALQWGLLILMLTPVARVVILTFGLFQQRDFAFGMVSLVILAVLGSSLYTAEKIHAARTRAAVAAPSAPPSH